MGGHSRHLTSEAKMSTERIGSVKEQLLVGEKYWAIIEDKLIHATIINNDYDGYIKIAETDNLYSYTSFYDTKKEVMDRAILFIQLDIDEAQRLINDASMAIKKLSKIKEAL